MSRRSQPTLPSLLKRKRRDSDDSEDQPRRRVASDSNIVVEPSSSRAREKDEATLERIEQNWLEETVEEVLAVEEGVELNEDKENECPPVVEELPNEDLGCFEIASSSPEVEVYDVPSENDDCTLLSPEPSRQQFPLTPIDNSHTWSRFRGITCLQMPSLDRSCPLPTLTWADEKTVWKMMCQQDVESTRRRPKDPFARHPLLQPRMRSVLLDWLVEVCEVYRFHRETYYLAMDFLDRYLGLTSNLPKTQLQLIGITCLFIAAKMEEIYPPKIGEFAYVTDGACTESEILLKEIAIMQCLEWRLSTRTVNYWLNVYMQLVSSHRRVNAKQQKIAARARHARRVSRSSLGSLCATPTSEVFTDHEEDLGSSFVYPQFSGLTFTEAVHLLDLCTLDSSCLQFSYSVLATAALHHTVSKDIALRFSGMQWEDIQTCVRWMTPYAMTLHREGPLLGATVTEESSSSQSSGLNKSVPNIVTDDSHNIQTHAVNLEMLEQAQTLAQKLSEEDQVKNLGLLTPPSSGGCKHLLGARGSTFT